MAWRQRFAIGPRVERTINDEDDYGDEDSDQIFMVACTVYGLVYPFWP